VLGSKECRVADHISVEELADAAEGLLAPERADGVRGHLDSCPTCRDTADLLSSVTATLTAEPIPPMPSAVVTRLDAVIAAEQARREAKSDLPTTATVASWAPRPKLAAIPAPRPHRARAAGWLLAAAALAVAVGFGGYVLSARAGFNEPSPGVAAVSSGDLRQQAGSLERNRDVDPHRFSRAWSCAREVTEGRITGIASVTVDGSPALLVYLENSDVERVAVVRGCDDGSPRVTATTPLTR
jgi:hypothetical protein